MEEDPRTSILVLKNYDGTNIPEFRQNLATYGVIKVTTVDGVQGGVEALKVDVNAANYQAELMQLKRAIVENGRGFDAKEERMDGDPNQMNIESMYTDIDLDVNTMETEFQAGFEELKWFIDQYLIHEGNDDYTNESAEFVFNRDFFINESTKIDNCVKSQGILSQRTIVAMHPWVTNLNRELSQIEDDKQAELEEMDATMKIQAKNTPKQAVKSSGGGSE
jgi:SPP1 family phage portal protein